MRRHEIHVRRFLGWHAQAEHGPWDEAFDVWSALVLSPEIVQQVRDLVEAELIARGVIVPHLEYEPPESEVCHA